MSDKKRQDIIAYCENARIRAREAWQQQQRLEADGRRYQAARDAHEAAAEDHRSAMVALADYIAQD